MDNADRLRALPKIDDALRYPRMASLLEAHPRQVVLEALRAEIDASRAAILAGSAQEFDPERLMAAVTERVEGAAQRSLVRVINATGIIVHTNLGRSILSDAAAAAVQEVAAGYSTLEYDVASGSRGSRHTHVEELLCKLTGAEAAMAVNNNAAAVMLGIAALARGGEAIVSRGQLVEIGGSFRIPDIMAESGATMVEVGATNKTHLRDYEKAIGPQTRLLLKVHSSNFRVMGFTEEVELSELVTLGATHGVPVFEDQGSGVLIDLRPFGLPYEPTVGESVAAGAALVSCSGDKLLGGPQAGILVGRTEIIARLKSHPMARALRLDKMTLAALEVTLRAYLDPQRAILEIPTLRMLTMSAQDSRARANSLAESIGPECKARFAITVQDGIARAGGGSLPLAEIPTVVVSLAPAPASVVDLEAALRLGSPSVVARINEGRLVLDPRTLSEHEIALVASALERASASLGSEV